MAKKSRLRIWGKKVLLIINILACVLFLYPLFFSPLPFVWINGFIGIITPYLVVSQVLFLIFWLIAKPLLSILSLISLLLGWQTLMVLAAWHPGTPFTQKKKENWENRKKKESDTGQGPCSANGRAPTTIQIC